MGSGWNDFGFGAWAAFCGPQAGFRAGRRHHHERGRRRMFDRGDLRYMILRLLAERPMHGYEVMQELAKESGGMYTPSPGSVYPVLQMLEDQGHVESEERDGKRVYRITESGRAFLSENRERVEDVFDRVSDFTDRFRGADMREVTKSFMRLAQVSFEEAMRRAGNAEAMTRLRDIMDRATKEMEESVRRAGEGPK
jgi:DNA-binding PadR family transcriptional regulator